LVKTRQIGEFPPKLVSGGRLNPYYMVKLREDFLLP
jgi:hypothetical protein